MVFEELLRKLKEGKKIGITSICSANKFVLKASMLHAKEYGYDLLIESTSNQVDQFGGYTGMTPVMFKDYVILLANKIDLPINRIILGGDHLGPNVWKNLTPDEAMHMAKEQVQFYADAGYEKFHLDTSFTLKGDETINGKLPPEVITERAAELCEVIEKVFNSSGKHEKKPFYVIGTDVPIPGGAIENEEDIEVTSAAELERTIEYTKKAFYSKGLDDAWERVVAVVVQPGVEFSDSKVLPYSHDKNKELITKINQFDDIYFEAHSTDYQTPENLKKMVKDKFIILKVGPWLTFALRESLFALSYIEDELLKFKKGMKSSGLIETIENVMKKNPKHWENYYDGTEEEIYISMRYSYSDRIRYYWTNSTIEDAVTRLINNLETVEIPDTLISQFLPKQYLQIREGKIKKKPEDLINNKISEVLSIYYSATGGEF